MRTKGKITSWNDEKGYGFIAPAAGGDQVFVHIKAFANRSRRPELNQVVTYALARDKQGRPCATRATLAGDRLPNTEPGRNGSLSSIGAIAFFVVLGAFAATAQIPPWLVAFYAGISLVTFVAYAIDKSAARKGDWRTPESTLHLLAVAGGWPGALVAQQTLRHKSRKQPFRIVFWMTVLLNGGVLVWVLTPVGQSALRMMLANIA